MSGMALAEQTDPLLQESASIFGQVFYFVTAAVFVAVGGHQMLIDALLGTFEYAPPGAVGFSETMAEQFLTLIGLGFELGVRAAAPLLVGLFLATLVLGLVSRTLPQINTLVVGFGINAMLVLGLMSATIGAVAWSFQEPIAGVIENLSEAVAL